MVIGIFTYGASIATVWAMSGARYPVVPSWGMHASFDFKFILVQLIIFGFLAGAIGGALAAVVYNKVMSPRSSPAV